MNQHWQPPLSRRGARRHVCIGACSTLPLVLHSRASSENFITNLSSAVAGTPRSARCIRKASVFAAGCCPGIKAVYAHRSAVQEAVSNNSGGSAASAKHASISSGRTANAESLHVTFDRTEVWHAQLAQIFFAVAHPTKLYFQGSDRDSPQCFVILNTSRDQQRIADVHIEQPNHAQMFDDPIVSCSVPPMASHAAAIYQRVHASRHPDERHVALHDALRAANLTSVCPVCT